MKMLLYCTRLLSRLPAQRQSLLNYPALLASRRGFSTDGGSKEVTSTVATQPKTPPPRPTGRLGLTDHRVNKLEKYFLVWGGKYKSVQEVPDLVSQDVLERARNKARIKINIMMCVATLLSCLAMVYSGKKAQKRGDSVVKMNEDWHKKYNEEVKIAQAKADHASN